VNVETEVEHERMKYDKQQQKHLYETLEQKEPSSLEQIAIIDHIMTTLHNNCRENNLIFVQGKGGSGKTALAKKAEALVRSEGHIVLGCASTALASTNYDDFYTAHSLVKYPVQENEDDSGPDLKCNLFAYPQRKELLEQSRMIIWDEWTNNHKNIFEAAYEALNGFEGKILLCLADLRQIPPVVPHGDKWQIIQASMVSSPLWDEFIKFNLTENFRLKAKDNTPESIRRMKIYDELTLAIGEGRTDCPYAIVEQQLNAESIMTFRIPSLRCCDIEDEVAVKNEIESIFPAGLTDNEICKRAILAATNKQVDKWNELIQKKLETTDTPIHILVSKDELCEADDPHNVIRSMLSEHFLNDFNNDNVPPHELSLRVGDICLLRRTLDRQEKLVNNSKVRIIKISRYSIEVLTLKPPQSVVILPRIRFKFRLPYGSFQMIRTQFPLRLAYSLTINKSQGQELERAILDLSIASFTHGQLYVGMSRAKTEEGISALADKDQITANGVIVTNVLYRELLEYI
jgi:hypothetical protein